MAAVLPRDLSSSCRSAAALLAQHSQALTQVLANLQVLLEAAAAAADTATEPGEAQAPAGQPQGESCRDLAKCPPAGPRSLQPPPPPKPAQPVQPVQPVQPANGGKGHGKGGWSPWPSFAESEPRFDGWTQGQWADWVQTPCGAQWCNNKRAEAEVIADWMVQGWGLAALRSGSGVLDVGGEPGFLAAALLSRGIPVTVVDLSWGKTGKNNHTTQIEDMEEAGLPEHARFRAVPAAFDESFVAEHRELVEACSALVSLYGDEATTPCLHYVRFFPPHHRHYEAYVQALLADANARGGRFQRGFLQRSPFSKVVLAQLPGTEEGRQMQQQLQVLQQQQELQQLQWQLQQQQQQQQQQHQQKQQQQQQMQQQMQMQQQQQQQQKMQPQHQPQQRQQRQQQQPHHQHHQQHQVHQETHDSCVALQDSEPSTEVAHL
ncbi:unnamed protein product [Effrenium voratum]|nr:unnamed protein product [Effrenium voratum]